MITLKPIKNRKEYRASLDLADKMFDNQVKPNSQDGEALQVALLLIKDYEDINFSIPTLHQTQNS